MLSCVSSGLLPVSQPFPDPTPCPIHPILSLFSLFMSIKTGFLHTNILGYMLIHWSIVNLLVATLRESCLSLSQKLFPIAQWLGVVFLCSSPVPMLGPHLGLTGLAWASHSFCDCYCTFYEFICALLCPEETIS